MCSVSPKKFLPMGSIPPQPDSVVLMSRLNLG